MSLTPFFGRDFRNGSIWDPFPSFGAFGGSAFDPLESFLTGFNHPLGRNSTSVDWVETPEAHVFKADLPGMKKEEIKVEVLDGRTLRISGERNKELVQEKDAWRCVERSHGRFLRQFGLPDNAKVEQVAAKVDNGVLTVTIPKSESILPPPVRIVEIA